MAADNKSKRTEANFAFSAFVLAIFGWALVETQLITSAAGAQAHLLASALGMAISATALRRCLRWWSVLPSAVVRRPVRKGDHIGNVISCFSLVAAGGVFALLEKAGSITLFLGYAGVFSFAPWTRISFCRRHFFISCAMLSAGAASIAVARGTAGPILNLFYAWVLWSIALSELLITSKEDRASTSRSEQAAPVESPSSVLGQDTLVELGDQTR